MADDDPCKYVRGSAGTYCREQHELHEGGGGGGLTGPGGNITEDGASLTRDLAEELMDALQGLLAPSKAWAPATADSAIYAPFMWLGQHLAIVIFTCVVVVCALTAWQGAPRLRQMGASTGWTLVACVAMTSVPGAVMLFNEAISAAFKTAFSSNELTLLGAIADDMDKGADSSNPLALLIIFAALVVALALAVLVFMARQLGIIGFVVLAPLVLASLARGGDMTAVKTWAQRLLGLMLAPFALLLVSPFVHFTKGALVMDALLLVAADVLMLRMIFHGVPYFGPRLARAAGALAESRFEGNRAVRVLARAGAPIVYEEETTPRDRRTVATPGRATARDASVLYAAYGGAPKERAGRLTTESAVDQARRHEADRAERTEAISQARREARAARGAGRPPAPRPAPNPPNQPAPAPPNPPQPTP
ncbi:hypothetical protein [Streptomyces sp. 021-3]|uniref:hypothetical protein n=1 Tax=Streptomyces sp. 021-3 TaxID=2789259 RepID=UPI003980C765